MMMMRMLWIKAIIGIIKKKLGVRYSKSSTTMMRISGIKEIVGKLMEELNHEGLNADIQREMEKLLTYIQELQYSLLEMEAALKAQLSNTELKSMRRPVDSIIHFGYPNSYCEGFVVSPDSGFPEGLSETLRGCRFAVIRNWKEPCHGLAQDITSRVSTRYLYRFCAWVGISHLRAPQSVMVSVKREYQDSFVIHTVIGRTSASPERWEKIEAIFAVFFVPHRLHRVTLYLEGLKPGVDVFIRSVAISRLNYPEDHQSVADYRLKTLGYDSQSTGSLCDENEIIQNPRFEDGLNNWSICRST